MLTDWLLRLRSLLRRGIVERELDDELRFHQEQQVASYIRQGLGRDEAVRRARIEFGPVAQIKDEHRDARGVGVIDDFGRDLRYAIRQLRRSPAFAFAVVVCLGLGVGAATAICSVVNTVVLRPLPFPNSDRLVRIVEHFTGALPGRVFERGITYQEFLEWRGRTATLADAAAVMRFGQMTMRTNNGWAGLWGASVSSNTFLLLGARPILGRTFVEADPDPDAVVLSFDTWQRHFNADPQTLGSAVELRTAEGQRLLTIVGVLPADFEFPTGAVDFYLPLAFDPSRPVGRVDMIAHLRPGVLLDAAIDEANLIGGAITPPRPVTAPRLPGDRFDVIQLKDEIVRPLRQAIRVLLVGVALLLLVVCANVANLLLARGTARQRELTLRLAIGASRGRLVRQLMTECLVVAVAGGILGALVGAAGVTLVKELAAIEAPGIFRLVFGSTILPRAHEVVVDVAMFGIALGITASVTVAFGLLPALQLSRPHHLRPHTLRGRRPRGGESRLRGTLVAAQLALATVLLVGAGLLANSFLKLSTVNTGYDASPVVALQLLFPEQYSTQRKAETIDAILARLRQLPDVHAAGFARHGMLIGEELLIGTFVPPGRTLEQMRSDPARPRVRSVSDGFFSAMGMPVLAGREFQTRDVATARPVIVINRSVARQHFGTTDPIGQFVDWHVGKTPVQTEVVGVVDDVRQKPSDEAYPEIYVNYRQLLSLMEDWPEYMQRQHEWAIGLLSFAVRTKGDPAAAVPTIRRLVTAVDSNIGIDAIVPMRRLVGSAVARERFYAVLMGVFAGMSALLASIGVYGLLAYIVIQRTQEIGTRMALGAQRIQVLALVLRRGLTLATIGITVGLVGAIAGTRLLDGLLFGINPLDPTTFIAVAFLFGALAIVASYIPARRATAVDPVVALKSE